MLSQEALGLDPAMLDEVRAYLRVDEAQEDATLGAILLSAIAHAEMFTRQTLIQRGVTETITASPEWRRLGRAPVVAVNGVEGIPADGAPFVMPETHYVVQIGNDGDGYVRVTQPGAAGRVEIGYTAGMTAHWADLAEALRFGILRLAGHLYQHRDGGGDAGPPAAVAALLRPWRRMRLG